MTKTNPIFCFSLMTLALTFALPVMAEDDPGKTLFQHNCAACHQVDGKGVPDAFPALAGNAFVQGSEKDVIAVVLNGRNGMPTFGKRLNDQDIAAILSYVRNAWGNRAAMVSATQVTTARSDLHAESFDSSQQNIRH